MTRICGKVNGGEMATHVKDDRPVERKRERVVAPPAARMMRPIPADEKNRWLSTSLERLSWTTLSPPLRPCPTFYRDLFAEWPTASRFPTSFHFDWQSNGFHGLDETTAGRKCSTAEFSGGRRERDRPMNE